MIRKAGNEDLEALVAANCAMALETEHVRLDPAVLRRGVGRILEECVPGTYWVYEDAGRVVAQLLITYEWSDWRDAMVWWIQSVYVQPEYRRRGLYAQLYRHVEAAARSAGAAGLRLYVDSSNAPAQDVYSALGMNGGHYRVFEAMFSEPPREA